MITDVNVLHRRAVCVAGDSTALERRSWRLFTTPRLSSTLSQAPPSTVDGKMPRWDFWRVLL